ncbi:MAG: hypothetical protein ACXWC9_01160 [Pseudobdellovibrionaceae bacterium]
MKQSAKWLWVLGAITSLNLLYANCAGRPSSTEEESLNSSAGTCGENLSDAARSPTSIDQVVTLINLLPKPLAMDCFIRALKKPLKVYSVNSPASLQPAVNQDNPRIFIINNKLILSVVPKGAGRMLLEISQKVSSTGSVKAELAFPIAGPIANDAPFSRIREGASGTSCRVCHQNEGIAAGFNSSQAFQSNIIEPLDGARVDRDYMKSQATFCNTAVDPYRCQMLKAIFIDGQAQDTLFP